MGTYKIQDLVDGLGLEIISNNISLDVDITGVYIGDLLSWVMANINRGNVWITIQTHVNTIAVASLAEACGIIIPESAEIDANTIAKAEEHNIPLLRSKLTAYELAKRISNIVDKK